MKSLTITSTDGELYRVNRNYLVDAYVGLNTISVTTIKGPRTLQITSDERARIVATLERWQEEEEYASA